jgi:hypothetical protein
MNQVDIYIEEDRVTKILILKLKEIQLLTLWIMRAIINNNSNRIICLAIITIYWANSKLKFYQREEKLNLKSKATNSLKLSQLGRSLIWPKSITTLASSSW